MSPSLRQHARARRRHVGSTVGVAVALLLCSGTADASDDGKELEAVMQKARAAVAQGDFRDLASLVAPSERALMAQNIDIMAGMVAGLGDQPEEGLARYRALLKKHGLERLAETGKEDYEGLGPGASPEEYQRHMRKLADETFADADVVAFVGDAMGLVQDMTGALSDGLFPDAPLTDVKVEADKATAQLAGEEVAFLREDGTWHLTATVFE